jgi:hypothetical protein
MHFRKEAEALKKSPALNAQGNTHHDPREGIQRVLKSSNLSSDIRGINLSLQNFNLCSRSLLGVELVETGQKNALHTLISAIHTYEPREGIQCGFN